LRKLHQEVFVLSLAEPVPEGLQIEGFDYTVVNEHEIEVEIYRDQSLNQLFAALNQLGLQVGSMRNKSNRLEELFMRLVERRDRDHSRHVAELEQAV